MRISPIGHLSSKHYYKRKRWQIVLVVVAIIAIFYAIFRFSGENITYSLAISGGVDKFKKGKLTYAISDFNHALNIRPNGYLALDGLGLIAGRQNDFEKAQKYYTEALAAGLKQNRTIDHTFYGDMYLDQGLYKNAAVEYGQALKLNANNPEALYGTGCCLHASGNLDDAINYYNKALMLNQKFTKARKNLSLAEEDRNKGAMYYLFDSNGEPLARYNLIKSETQRTYILDQKTAHITGFVSKRHNRSEGIEKYLAEYIPGNKIYLTIDTRVQNAVAKSMGWYKGAVVVLKPSTGEILALYSQPTYRPNTIEKDWWKVVDNVNQPLLNRATDKLYEPGSIAKVITVAAAFERSINEKDVYPIKCAGSTQFDGQSFWCSQKHGKIKSIAQTIELSCNIGCAFLGFAVGSPTLTEYNQKFGFGRQFDIGFYDKILEKNFSIPIKESFAPQNDKTRYETALHSCGLSIPEKNTYTITPLHAAMLAAAIANNGVMMSPYIIKEIRNINGKIIYQGLPSEAKRSIAPATAKKITDLMIKTVNEGIGKKAQVKGLTIAGKTGTSGGKNGILNAWFISFAPAEAPQYAISVLGDGEGKGMTVAAPVAGEIYKELLK
ncbi:MAG: penicillin-binding transpeptidase domain-containing protein [bacterium]